MDEAIPALLRKGALEAIRGQLESSRNDSALGRWGVDVSLTVNGAGDHVLRVVSVGGERGLLGYGSTGSPAVRPEYLNETSEFIQRRFTLSLYRG